MKPLTEEEIRPQHLMEGQQIAALTDVGRMLSRCSDFVHVACPACRIDDPVPRYTKNGLEYVVCSACDTMYVTPRPPPEVLEWFYEGSPNYAYWNEHIFPASEAARRERIFVPRVDRLLGICERYDVLTESLLEVGAGFGTFCAELSERQVFQRVAGVEPTPDLAETCRQRGIEVIESPIERVGDEYSGLFDVVASFEVIEHLFDPAAFVQHTLKLLKPGGLMILTCPNGQGFDIETLGPVSASVDHEHLNYFNPDSLGRLLTANDMEVLESFTPGVLDAELVRNKVLSGHYSLQGQPFLQKTLIGEWDQLGGPFQTYLIENGLSSNLWVVARSGATAPPSE